jgi:hypothetical protein
VKRVGCNMMARASEAESMSISAYLQHNPLPIFRQGENHRPVDDTMTIADFSDSRHFTD